MTVLAGDLKGPIKLALAWDEEATPHAWSLPGGAAYELKRDGYRVAVVRDDHDVRRWSRQSKSLTGRFLDLAAATVDQLEPGTVLMSR